MSDSILAGNGGMVLVEWASLHRAELLDDWDLARQGLSLKEIEPLQ